MVIDLMAMVKSKSLKAPFYPSPIKVVDEMIKLAELKPGEKLLDLGCGDSRILIRTALKMDDVECHGVEINPDLVEYSRRKISKLSLSGRVKVFQGNLLNFDLKRYNVITMYLTPQLINALKEKFHSLRRGSRLISHDYRIPGLTPIEVRKVDVGGRSHKIYLYVL